MGSENPSWYNCVFPKTLRDALKPRFLDMMLTFILNRARALICIKQREICKTRGNSRQNKGKFAYQARSCMKQRRIHVSGEFGVPTTNNYLISDCRNWKHNNQGRQMRNHRAIIVKRDLNQLLTSFPSQIDPKVAFPRRAHPKVGFVQVILKIDITFSKNILST